MLLAHADAAGNDGAPDGSICIVDDRAGDHPVVHDRDVDDVLGPESVGVETPGGIVD